MVPLERLGLYFETCHDDDQAERANNSNDLSDGYIL